MTISSTPNDLSSVIRFRDHFEFYPLPGDFRPETSSSSQFGSPGLQSINSLLILARTILEKVDAETQESGIQTAWYMLLQGMFAFDASRPVAQVGSIMVVEQFVLSKAAPCTGGIRFGDTMVGG